MTPGEQEVAEAAALLLLLAPAYWWVATLAA